MSQRPRIGLLGIMQELYDEMIPGITDHQAQYAASVAERLAPVAEVMFTRPARNQQDVADIGPVFGYLRRLQCLEDLASWRSSSTASCTGAWM